ncbi:hypothetical protein HDF24_07360 [Mucilaginibacter sp. X4EP1]|uniref:hypothetical protein n=1 Tax=Mucilaginibacter sp. X4EP1 TaxID=2723092 RepID=UPI002167B765|nr:hypothetical protein [Mucilaginibacter sp. X4EP1]MCS3814128.1 hypothetical protein [Mucilaginibacter sp. X4EP1]
MQIKPITLSIVIVAFSILASCKVILIGAYDQVTDQGIQKIQTDVSQLLITLKKNLVNNNASANQYSNFDKTYSAIEGEVESLNIRCKALPKYSIVVGQLGAVNKNIIDLESLHKIDDFKAIRDTSIMNNVLSTLEVQFTAMVSLQNGLKNEKN